MTGDNQSHSADRFETGKILAGRYELRSVLGRGGMGVVFRALDLERQREIALKTLQHFDADQLYALKNEFRQLADVIHPNLVRLGELIRDGDQWFFTMEFIQGDDLRTYVRGAEEPNDCASTTTTAKTGPSFDERRVKSVLGQLGEGLSALHHAGKVHRDVKPENALVQADGRVVLLDFGLVTDAWATSRTEDRWILGTPIYMAPEQARQQPVGPEADWYGVGVMLYEILTGRPPFEGAALEILERKQRHLPPPPRDIAGATPSYLDALCMGLLTIDPAKRLGAREVRASLDTGTTQGRAPTVSTPPPPARGLFVGRSKELERLTEAFRASRTAACAVVVRGESGVGKSALVRQFGILLKEAGEDVLVLSGRCYERESVPYQAFDALVDALTRFLIRRDPVDAARLLPRERDAVELLRIFPVLQRVPAFERIQLGGDAAQAHELRRRAFAALRELLGRLSDRQGLILTIDDLQWADSDSSVLMHELLRPPEAPRLLLVGTCRNGKPELPCDSWEIDLGGLDPNEACVLAERLGALPAAARVIAREAQGHPLFIQELATHAARLAHLQLDELLRDRIDRLDQPSAHLLELVATAGVPIPLQRLAEAAEVATGSVMHAIEALYRVQLLRTVGRNEPNLVECYHDRIRETVLAGLSPQRLSSLNSSLALTLERGGAGEQHPERLGRHFELGGDRLRAARYALKAAALAEAALAFEQAAEGYRRALRLGSFATEERRHLLRMLGRALINAARGPEAAEVFVEAAHGAPEDEALDCRRQAAEQLLISGHLAEGLGALREVVSAVGIRLPSAPWKVMLSLMWRRLRLRLRGLTFTERGEEALAPAARARIDICWSAAMGLSMIDPIRGAEFQARHLMLSLEAGEISRIAHSLAMEAGHLASVAARVTRRAAQALEMARALAATIDQPYSHAAVELSAGIVDYLCGRWRTGLVHLDRASTIFRERCTGAAWELDTGQLFAIFALWFSGEVAELGRRVRRLVQEAEQRGDFYAALALKTSLGNAAWLIDDDVADARRHLSDARQSWTVPGFQVQSYFMLLGEANLLLYSGEGKRAFELMTHSWGPLAWSLLLRVQIIDAPMRHLRAASALAAAVGTNDATERRALLDAALRDARKLASKRIAGFSAVSQLLAAGVAVVRGFTQVAVSSLERAASDFDASGMALYAAATRHRLGELVGGVRGHALIAEAQAFMAIQGIRNPKRMLQLLAPGFEER